MVFGYLWSKSDYEKPVAEIPEKSETNVRPHDAEESGLENTDAESPPEYTISFSDCWDLLLALIVSCLPIYYSFYSRDQRSEIWQDVHWMTEQKWTNTGPTLQKARKYINRNLVMSVISLLFNARLLMANVKSIRFVYPRAARTRGKLSMKIAETTTLLIILVLILASIGFDVVNLVLAWKDRASILSMGTGTFMYKYKGLEISAPGPLIESKPWWKNMI